MFIDKDRDKILSPKAPEVQVRLNAINMSPRWGEKREPERRDPILIVRELS